VGFGKCQLVLEIHVSFKYIPPKGVFVPGLSECSAVVYEGDMYIFGGSNGEEYSSEVFKVNFSLLFFFKKNFSESFFFYFFFFLKNIVYGHECLFMEYLQQVDLSILL
jgi:hypothetical protein